MGLVDEIAAQELGGQGDCEGRAPRTASLGVLGPKDCSWYASAARARDQGVPSQGTRAFDPSEPCQRMPPPPWNPRGARRCHADTRRSCHGETLARDRPGYSPRPSAHCLSWACVRAPLSRAPSSTVAPGASLRMRSGALPKPLPPLVAKGTIVLPAKS